jgi:glycosyltransferase involved in cell wall biosynthesis
MIESTTLYTSNTPLVSICCSTYNHEKYIGDALDGFLIQNCNFPVEILIHEDCSTDKTAAIIKEYQKKYPGIIKSVFQKENQYSKGIKPFTQVLYPRAKGKYIAFCEGDDYWTDPSKLQKQVVFLEENPDYALCVGGYKQIYNNKPESVNIIKIPPGINKNEKGFSFTLNDQKKSWLTQPLTAVFRNDKIVNVSLLKYKKKRDTNLFYHLLKTGKGFYFTEIMGVYRIHEGGTFSMNHGRINNNSSYIICKELYQINKDEYSRYWNIRFTVALLRYNLYNKYPGNNIQKKVQLYFEIISLVRNFKDFTFLFSVFLTPKFLFTLKRLWNYAIIMEITLVIN